MINGCKKCLLLEAGEQKSYKGIQDYLDTVDSELKADEAIYQSRLEKCRDCDMLISGMCLKCGCYVEVRAAFKEKKCADYDNCKW